MDVYLQVHIFDRYVSNILLKIHLWFLKEGANCLDWIVINGI